MGQGVIVEDRRTGVVLVNPIARSILGLTEHERVEGRPMADLFPPEIREQVSSVIAERWRSGEPASERFSQIGPTLTGKPKGTGLGLVL